VLAFSAFHALVELGRIAGASVGAVKIGIAAALSVVFVSMHLRHLWFATHGGRPPHGKVTLAAMAAAELVGLVVVGVPWTGDLYALGVSALVVLAPPWSLVVVAASVLEPLATSLPGIMYGAEVSTFLQRLNGCYALLADVLSQFVVVWLIAAVYRLELSRGALAAASAEQERERVLERLRASLNRNLGGLLDAGRQAEVQIGRQGVAGAVLALDGLIEFSHAALSDLRRVVADARTPAGSSAAEGLIEAARSARTPVGRALSRGRRAHRGGGAAPHAGRTGAVGGSRAHRVLGALRIVVFVRATVLRWSPWPNGQPSVAAAVPCRDHRAWWPAGVASARGDGQAALPVRGGAVVADARHLGGRPAVGRLLVAGRRLARRR
jgi:hypothetical protein